MGLWDRSRGGVQVGQGQERRQLAVAEPAGNHTQRLEGGEGGEHDGELHAQGAIPPCQLMHSGNVSQPTWPRKVR